MEVDVGLGLRLHGVVLMVVVGPWGKEVEGEAGSARRLHRNGAPSSWQCLVACTGLPLRRACWWACGAGWQQDLGKAGTAAKAGRGWARSPRPARRPKLR